MRKLLVGIIVLSMLFIAGCLEAEIHLVINPDGSGDLSFEFGMDNSILDMLAMDGDDPLVEMAKDAEADGYTVTINKGDEVSGFRATRHLDTITPQDLDIIEASTSGPGLVLDTSGSATKYTFEYNFDLTDSDADFGDFESDMFNYVFMITSPEKPDSHNADSVSSDGKTMTWLLKPGQQNQVRFTATGSGGGLFSGVIGFIIIGAVLLLVVLALIIVSKTKKRPRYYEPINLDSPRRRT